VARLPVGKIDRRDTYCRILCVGHHLAGAGKMKKRFTTCWPTRRPTLPQA
jgi:hypothetical protein